MAAPHPAILLPNVAVVLARPSEPRNIGATCRAIKNFGIHRLVVVTEAAIDYDAARPLAIGADDVLRSAVVHSSLAEAVSGATLVAGTTRRLGQKRKDVSYTAWEFAEMALSRFDLVGPADAPRDSDSPAVAIVFGNERSGLSDDELQCCHVAVSIPTSPACPSLNLSHAVGIVAYELYKAAAVRTGVAPTGAARSYPSAMEIESYADSIVGSLGRLGFLTQEGPQGMRTFVRDIVARASLSRDEASRLDALFAKLAGMHGPDRRRVSHPFGV
ncbi:MAG: RNA methyltransferase [Spirochaetales bacterium]